MRLSFVAAGTVTFVLNESAVVLTFIVAVPVVVTLLAVVAVHVIGTDVGLFVLSAASLNLTVTV